MRIIGLDPGYALVGWAVVDFDSPKKISLVDYGVIETSKDQAIGERLHEIYKDLQGIISEFKPTHGGVETLIFHKNITTGMAVSEARGVINLALEEAQISVVRVNPLQLKNSIAGYGRADKKQVQENIRLLLGMDDIPKPDDAADAIAVAVCTYDLVRNVMITA